MPVYCWVLREWGCSHSFDSFGISAPCFAVVKDVVVDRYKGDFEYLLRSVGDTNAEVPKWHQKAVDRLIGRAIVDLLNELTGIGELKKDDVVRVIGLCETGCHIKTRVEKEDLAVTEESEAPFAEVPSKDLMKVGGPYSITARAVRADILA